ncbi:arsinothricin resistance N-acetyltransferase ArsN1 family B [Halomicroarcula sp. GCM10025709]|uniref:arsinothricin resistance N-acetyltransferase ArsN1 family B n=1 Tax=Haloarcula TaxID=2237 RepID=UPI0024C29094|nr:arsinothricin resistance N-acetyltransferase ArsN1 family B [Halomicroarcula sp. YJ-61-S]
MVEIRLAGPADAPACREIYAPFVRDSAITFETELPGEAAFAERLSETLEQHPWLVCEHDGRVLGYAYASPHRSRGAYKWAVESSVYVAENARRCGVAGGLYQSLFAVLERQGYRNVYAGITVPNPPSTALHDAMGFDRVGTYEDVGYKHGEWHDVEWWARSLRDDDEPPSAPIPIPELDSDAVASALATGTNALSL